MRRLEYSNASDKEYYKYLSLYHGWNGTVNQKQAINGIKALLSKETHPTDAHLKYHLADFCYDCPEMHTSDMAIELLAINLLASAEAEGVYEAKRLLRLIKKEHHKLALKDDAKSQFLLGFHLALQDNRSGKAGKWLKAAADQSHSYAEYWVGVCCLEGICGLPRDNTMAYDYTHRAYRHGQTIAAYNLGCFYDRGLVVSLNKDEAKKYWEIAHRAGHPKAQMSLDELAAHHPTQAASPKQEFDVSAMSFVQMIAKRLDQVDAHLQKQDEALKEHEENARSRHRSLETLMENIPTVMFERLENEFGKIKEGYRRLLPKFEKMDAEIQNLSNDVQVIKKTTLQTKNNFDSLASQMQQFFEKMDNQSIELAGAAELSDLKSYHTDRLANLFGDFWNAETGALLASSKQSLIAARVLLDCAKEYELKDCRGIVISATSALERELKARFYTGCREYFKSKTDDCGKLYDEDTLPEVLKCKIRRKDGKLLYEEDFNLGKLSYILKCVDFGTGNKLSGYTTDDQILQLRSYLKEKVISPEIIRNGKAYNSKRPEDLFSFCRKNKENSFTARVTAIANKYRNPAAHAQETTLAAAEACCKDVIGESSEHINKIEGILLELLALTDNFKHRL